MRRYFRSFRELFKGDFNGFLAYIIKNSRYNKKAIEYFRHYIEGYIFKDNYKAF